MADALAAAVVVNNDANATQKQILTVYGALLRALNSLGDMATITCTVKSMIAKIGKPLEIPVDWNGVGGLGALTFATSNAVICNVVNGVLIPLKAGTAVITITAPGGAKYLFTVTVTA